MPVGGVNAVTVAQIVAGAVEVLEAENVHTHLVD